MKSITSFFFSFCISLTLIGQSDLDSIYFLNGDVEAVELKELSESKVVYTFPGEAFTSSSETTRLLKVVTRTGRVIEFENTARLRAVMSAEDWEKVEISNVASEVEGLIRIDNVSGRAQGVLTTSSLAKMQTRAMQKMRMQAAFMGCDVIYMLSQSNEDAQYGGGLSSSKSASSTMTGTAYAISTSKPNNVLNGSYKLFKAYKLLPNHFQLESINVDPSSTSLPQTLDLSLNMFEKEEDFYSIEQNTGIPDSKNKMHLISYTDDIVVFLVIDRSLQGKFKYYNIYYAKSSPLIDSIVKLREPYLTSMSKQESNQFLTDECSFLESKICERFNLRPYKAKELMYGFFGNVGRKISTQDLVDLSPEDYMSNEILIYLLQEINSYEKDNLPR